MKLTIIMDWTKPEGYSFKNIGTPPRFDKELQDMSLLHRWRMYNSISQADAGRLFHYSVATVSAWERGRVRVPQEVINYIREHPGLMEVEK